MALALALAACASLPVAARAQGDAEEVLVRAREGLALSRYEREAAAGLLDQWRQSEEVAPGTGDPFLGRALEAMAFGRALAPDEVGALRRFDEARLRERAEGAGAGPGSRAPEGAGEPGTLSLARGGGVRRLVGAYWFAPAAGAGVVVLGAAWILAARAFRGRWR